MDRGFDQSYSLFKTKKLTPWLSFVTQEILRNGAALWKRAYSRFYKNLSKILKK